MLMLEYPDTLRPGRARERIGINALADWAAFFGYRPRPEKGSFACESRESALVCASMSGRGLSLSVQKVRLF